MPDDGPKQGLIGSRKYWLDQDEEITLQVAKFLAEENGVEIETLKPGELVTALRFINNPFVRVKIFRQINTNVSE